MELWHNISRANNLPQRPQNRKKFKSRTRRFLAVLKEQSQPLKTWFVWDIPFSLGWKYFSYRIFLKLQRSVIFSIPILLKDHMKKIKHLVAEQQMQDFKQNNNNNKNNSQPTAICS